MNDYSTKLINPKMPSSTIELNNNSEQSLHLLDDMYRQRSESRTSTSSTSSSEISDEIEVTNQESPTDENANKDNPAEEPGKTRLRSMSDGFPTCRTESFEVFPSLPDSALEKMGLLGDRPRERINEEELEEKFVALALAFTIDAATIKDRCERQRRYRDQTETNLSVEIDRLIQKVHRMQPLCVDAETTELLTDLLAQVDTVMRASAHAAISAERFGAVQHEERLAQSVHLMINHVTLLKQQRDSARRHLQYTKRMLQDSNASEAATSKPKVSQPNGLIPSRRRASIASMNQQQDPIKTTPDTRRVTRRTSELSLRASALPRTTRPSRLELGVDLVKIREGTVEGVEPIVSQQKENKTDNAISESKVPAEDVPVPETLNVDFSSLPLKQKIIHHLRKCCETSRSKFKTWTDNGTLHEMLSFAALMCLSLGVISLGNVLVELECAKRGRTIPGSLLNFDCFGSNFWSFLRHEYENRESLRSSG